MLLSELTARHLPMGCRRRRVTLAALLLVVSVGCHEASAQQADSPTKDVSEKTEPAKPAGADEDDKKSEAEQSDDDEKQGWMEEVDGVFGEYFVGPMAKVLFFDFWSGEWKDADGKTRPGWLGTKVPFVVVWLSVGALFFTFRMGFINFRGFFHALRITRGDYDDPNDAGEVTHLQALCSALSATVGLGNIAGVAIAVGTGGPGAVFWMILAGFFGMTSKFVECTLAQMYRRVAPDGTVSGGPMRYLRDGLAEKNLAPLGSVLAVMFTVLCIGGSVGGGCAFQVVQSKGILAELIPFLEDHGYVYGIVMAFLVGLVIIGGIRRIAATAEKVVPSMCAIYILISLTILVMHYDRIFWAIGEILNGAFTGEGIAGGVIGVLVIGIKRATFSNEAGVGSAAIAHSAAKTKYPIREGLVASLGPFIDTVIVCTMTGLVIVITQAYDTSIFPENAELIKNDQGAKLTSVAFAGVVWWFPYVLAVTVTLFAYSTMISWSYYGERCFTHLFGARSSMVYKIMFLGFVLLGSIVTAKNILEFSDLMILSMALPNILGALLLSGKVRAALKTYWDSYRAGEFKTFK